jgi:hypothetical protein
MPDTHGWRVLTSADRAPPPVGVDTLDQIDSLMEECARGLGFTLDQPTVEAAIFGIAAGRFVQHHAYGHDEEAELGPHFEREMVNSMGLVRWLLIERLHRMERT